MAALMTALFLAALTVPVAGTVIYLFLLTALSARLRAPAAAGAQLRFDVLVPAHNEEPVIERAVRSLLLLNWPRNQFRVVVVADNCSDSTAELAARAGATVYERNHDLLRGKGHALRFAFDRSAAEGRADAVVVVDADSEVSGNLLAALASRLASGEQAVQVHYGPLNPLASWRTRLITVALAAFHIVRSRARERLGVSCGVRGNGWCVTHALLRRLPYECYSLAEDLEYSGVLGLAGVRVAYADEAQALGEMTSNAAAAGRQRQRWESGRFELARTQLPPLLAAAAQRPSKVCLDLALDLLTLPLTYIALGVGLLVAASTGAWLAGLTGPGWLVMAATLALLLAGHVLRGWQLSGVGLRGLLDLLRVPGFIAWRVIVALRPKPRDWVRTDREGPGQP
jgi:cellulose synthase/poly-beta-1,6-N-acetylglucosamine synthase-like glycosyltransferase